MLRTHDPSLLHAIDSLAAQRHFQLTPIPLLLHESSLYNTTHCTILSTPQRFLPLSLQQTLPNYLPNVAEIDSTFEQELEQI